MLLGRDARDSLGASLAAMRALRSLRLHRVATSARALPPLDFLADLTTLTSLQLSGLDEQAGHASLGPTPSTHLKLQLLSRVPCVCAQRLSVLL